MDRVSDINHRLAQLKQGTVTRLTNDNDIWDFYKDCCRPFPKTELAVYLANDVIGIIKKYLDWRELKGPALFDVPLHVCFSDRRFLRLNQLFFGRFDGQEFDVTCFNTELHMRTRRTLSGHFPLICRHVYIQIGCGADDERYNRTRFLIGLYNTNTIKEWYPDLRNCFFQWTSPTPHVLTDQAWNDKWKQRWKMPQCHEHLANIFSVLDDNKIECFMFLP